MNENERKEEKPMTVENAKITNVSITMADHGCLTFWLTLEGSGWGCGFGGYCIGKGYRGAKEFSAKHGWGLEAMMRIMDTVGVETWENLKGKYVRAEIESWGGTITKIGNIMDNKWFDIKEFFAEKEKRKE